jgi:hypothetical protein
VINPLVPKGRQERMVVVPTTAAEAAPRRRLYRVAAQPFLNAVSEGLALGWGSRQTTIELGDARPLVKKRLPIIGGP